MAPGAARCLLGSGHLLGKAAILPETVPQVLLPCRPKEYCNPEIKSGCLLDVGGCFLSVALCKQTLKAQQEATVPLHEVLMHQAAARQLS